MVEGSHSRSSNLCGNGSEQSEPGANRQKAIAVIMHPDSLDSSIAHCGSSVCDDDRSQPITAVSADSAATIVRNRVYLIPSGT